MPANFPPPCDRSIDHLAPDPSITPRTRAPCAISVLVGANLDAITATAAETDQGIEFLVLTRWPWSPLPFKAPSASASTRRQALDCASLPARRSPRPAIDRCPPVSDDDTDRFSACVLGCDTRGPHQQTRFTWVASAHVSSHLRHADGSRSPLFPGPDRAAAAALPRPEHEEFHLCLDSHLRPRGEDAGLILCQCPRASQRPGQGLGRAI